MNTNGDQHCCPRRTPPPGPVLHPVLTPTLTVYPGLCGSSAHVRRPMHVAGHERPYCSLSSGTVSGAARRLCARRSSSRGPRNAGPLVVTTIDVAEFRRRRSISPLICPAVIGSNPLVGCLQQYLRCMIIARAMPTRLRIPREVRGHIVLEARQAHDGQVLRHAAGDSSLLASCAFSPKARSRAPSSSRTTPPSESMPILIRAEFRSSPTAR